ncbi:MAG: response regulator [Brevundimonas sp.]|nr:response regulator [Brevundimonas sp.]
MAVIVIVDDDPTIRLIAAELLRPDNHVVLEAEDGDEALKVVGSMAVDLVVLDMLMPNKDGLETIIELRRTQPGIRILAISSGGRVGADQLLRTAMMLGADETMVKPLRLDTFAATVSRLLSQPQPTSMQQSEGA